MTVKEMKFLSSKGYNIVVDNGQFYFVRDNKNQGGDNAVKQSNILKDLSQKKGGQENAI